MSNPIVTRAAGSLALVLALAVFGWAPAAASPVPSNPAPPASLVPTWGKVFIDLDEDGVYDAGTESGLADVEVSNGQTSFLTDANGEFTTTVNTYYSRFVFMSLPSGYRSTTDFYHRAQAVAADTAWFGIRPDPSLLEGPYYFVQITDSEVITPTDGDDFTADMQEVANAVPSPSFVVSTGDLVTRGIHREQFTYYKQPFIDYPIPVHHVFGNHDVGDGPFPTSAYEDSLGPSYYSFNHFGCHFIAYNSTNPPAAQEGWFASDIAHMPPGSRLFILRHTPPYRVELDQYVALGVEAVLSGHWHGNRVRRHEGLIDINSANITFPGMDRTPRGFQLTHVPELGSGEEITCEYRWGGFSHYTKIVSPAQSASVARAIVPLRVNAYDSSHPVAEVTVTITGPQGTLPPFMLEKDSPWNWAAQWDASSLPAGNYFMAVSLRDTTGSTWGTGEAFALTNDPPPVVVTGQNWDQAQGGVDRQGHASDEVRPPLRLTWVAPAGGEAGMSSPVVRDGVVYLGTTRTHSFNQCGVTAFDAVTGARLWRTNTTTDIKNTVTASYQGVYAVTVNGHMMAFDRNDGHVLWSIALTDTADRWETSGTVVAAGRVYGGRAVHFGCYSSITGAKYWSTCVGFDFVPWDYSDPAISGSNVFLGSSQGFFCFDISNGNVLWSLPGYFRDGTVDGQRVYTVGGDFQSQYLGAYSIADGSLAWINPLDLRNTVSTPALADSILVVGSGIGTVNAFNSGNGSLRWTFATDNAVTSSRPYIRVSGDVCSSPAVSGSTVYVGSSDGRIYALDLHSGSLLWSYDVGLDVRSSPAISGNAMYIAGDDGCLYAFTGASSVTGVPGEGAQTESGADAGAPAKTGLTLMVPSPLQPGDRFFFAAQNAAMGELVLVDVTGRRVRRLFRGRLDADGSRLTWDGKNGNGQPLAPGVYFAALTGGGETVRAKVVITRP